MKRICTNIFIGISLTAMLTSCSSKSEKQNDNYSSSSYNRNDESIVLAIPNEHYVFIRGSERGKDSYWWDALLLVDKTHGTLSLLLGLKDTANYLHALL